jgi:N-methylhydantoinase A/oxoprolinase/acetone carboxylase beta subunit
MINQNTYQPLTIEDYKLLDNYTATSVKPRSASAPRAMAAPIPHRLRWNGRWLNARRIAREALPVGQPHKGPLLITELSATTMVPPSWTVQVMSTGDLILSTRSDSALSTLNCEL